MKVEVFSCEKDYVNGEKEIKFRATRHLETGEFYEFFLSLDLPNKESKQFIERGLEGTLEPEEEIHYLKIIRYLNDFVKKVTNIKGLKTKFYCSAVLNDKTEKEIV